MRISSLRRRKGMEVIIVSGENALSAPCHTLWASQPPPRWTHDNSVPLQVCVGASLYLGTFSQHGELETVDKFPRLCSQDGKFLEAFCIFQRNSSKINSPPLTIAKALIILPNAFFSSFTVSLSLLLHPTSWDYLQNILPVPYLRLCFWVNLK